MRFENSPALDGSNDPATKPLEGLRVLDFGRFVAGPFCAALMADLGADVIRCDKIGGSEDRSIAPLGGEGAVGGYYLQCNRNKRGISFDPSTESGREILRRLVRSADIVVANMPEPALKSLGIDYASLTAIRPDIILTWISAFGSTGPYKDRVGFDGLGQAMSGAIHLGGRPGDPVRTSVPYVDFLTATSAAFGTVSAVLQRARTGKGQLVEGSLLASALNTANSYLIEESLFAPAREGFGNRSPFFAPCDIYETQDGRIMLQVMGAPLFRRWARLVGRGDLADDPGLSTDRQRALRTAEISEIMERWCAARTTAQALAELEKAKLPAGPVYSARQVIDDAHVRETGMLVPSRYPGIDGVIGLVKAPVLIEGQETAFERAPLLGEHTREVLLELDFSDGEIDGFAASGIIDDGEPARQLDAAAL